MILRGGLHREKKLSFFGDSEDSVFFQSQKNTESPEFGTCDFEGAPVGDSIFFLRNL